ncbi:MAG TPA: nitroreductase family protein [Marmoricola sp.]|nr:nitroreductase family protein [Marmoricola sp.]
MSTHAVGPELHPDIHPDIHPLLRDRVSGRSFDAEHVLPEEDLVRLLEAARWAPSAGNSQPWSFVVARRGEDAHERMVARLSRGVATWAPAASALVLTLHRVGHDEDPSMAYSDYAAYDLGQAVAFLTVQAQSMGLAVHQFAGFDHAAMATAFEVPASWQLTTGVAVGRRAPAATAAAAGSDAGAEAGPRVRNVLADFVFTERYGEPRWR